ncbi:unnamed protein product [Pocillopora meandrina]|uniref:Integrase core domain-containing protein n=1 Tax=Pocillopora meandrina TaxID=46732 RepID=A0AAU9XB86_9CNID|nr:unnamed protein product [Pocillopora meandrina]
MVSNKDIDGNHKLIQPYRIVIYGGLDGFLRMIVFLQASTNNRASTALQHFQSAVEHYNLPSRVRSDLGMENIEVACFMLQERVYIPLINNVSTQCNFSPNQLWIQGMLHF